MRKLDKVDLQLIKILSQNSRLTYRELAEMLGTTRQRIARRMEKLKKLGVIKKFTILPDLEKLGYMYAVVLIKLKPMADVDKVVSDISDIEYVKIIEKGVGRYNLIVHILVPKDLSGAENRVNEFLSNVKDIENVEVVFVSKVPKFEIV
ncbi:transcriptional regulator [Thermococcus chitonophagus]|uniref:Transcriptional regulator n=1 Tax=Thermococcus chitonophagus TaxID=54262 RepID=A0A160VQX5_9EURY|nr:Lrp/AsnC family transcriptional regulator [Thermococcus chitonophagus]ASJ15721.1 transcriptional regulator [Thermococcus chitonophagus]CUX76939.1 Transcriptional regulator, AsnC family [Thermococcus chitonophagus]